MNLSLWPAPLTIPCTSSCLSGVPLCFLAKSVTANPAHLTRAQPCTYPTAVGPQCLDKQPRRSNPSNPSSGWKWGWVRKPFTANLGINIHPSSSSSWLLNSSSHHQQNHLQAVPQVTKARNSSRWLQRMGSGRISSPRWRRPAWGAPWRSGGCLQSAGAANHHHHLRVDTAQPFDGVVHGPNRWDSWLLPLVAAAIFSEDLASAFASDCSFGLQYNLVVYLHAYKRASSIYADVTQCWCYLDCRRWLLLLRTEPGCSVQGTGGLKTYLKVSTLVWILQKVLMHRQNRQMCNWFLAEDQPGSGSWHVGKLWGEVRPKDRGTAGRDRWSFSFLSSPAWWEMGTFFSCPGQLNRWHCQSVSQSLSETDFWF